MAVDAFTTGGSLAATVIGSAAAVAGGSFAATVVEAAVAGGSLGVATVLHMILRGFCRWLVFVYSFPAESRGHRLGWSRASPGQSTHSPKFPETG